MPRILKYGPLTSFLQEHTESSIDLAFEDVEEVIGTNLPPASRVHRVWWNDGHGGSQTRGWLDAGWSMAGVDLSLGRVTFRRKTSDPAVSAADHPDADQIEASATQVLAEDEADPVTDQLKPVKMSNGQAGRLGEALALAKLISLNLPSYVSPEGAPGP